jgi:hypothetical protein
MICRTPLVPEVVKPFFTEAEITALLRACIGQDFESRRDTAIIRIVADTRHGVRPGRAAVQRRG